MLISRLSAIGDVAMTIPVIYSLCRSYPDYQFVMLTKPRMAAMFVNPPANLSIELPQLDGRHKGLAGIRRLAHDLRHKYHITAYADLHNVIRSRILGFFLSLHGIKTVIVDKGRAEKLRLIKKGPKIAGSLKPQIERYADTFRRLGLTLTAPFEGLWGGHALAPGQYPADDYVVIAPFAAHPGKIYPPELMEQVIKGLINAGLKIIILGGGGTEQQIADGWAACFPEVTSLAGKNLGFARELEIINHAAATIAMDSGNMHLSALANTPTVSIWGATHPACGFAPWLQEAGIVQSTLVCRPCSVYGNKPCRLSSKPLCMEAIEPETIIDTTLKLIKNG